MWRQFSQLQNRPVRGVTQKKGFASLRLCVSSLHRDHANLLCIFKRLFNATGRNRGISRVKINIYKLKDIGNPTLESVYAIKIIWQRNLSPEHQELHRHLSQVWYRPYMEKIISYLTGVHSPKKNETYHTVQHPCKESTELKPREFCKYQNSAQNSAFIFICWWFSITKWINQTVGWCLILRLMTQWQREIIIICKQQTKNYSCSWYFTASQHSSETTDSAAS